MKTFQIESGEVQGFYKANSPIKALSKAMKLNSWSKNDLGLLIKFREVTLSRNFEIVKKGKWYYQSSVREKK